MNQGEIKFVGELARVTVNPGDRLVLMYPHRLRAEQREHLGEIFKQEFPEAGRLIILEDGMTLGIVEA